jgi:hypothetical protein
MLYVVYTRCADEYEIVTIEDYYQSAVATGNALVNANCDDGTTATEAFIHTVVPDGTEQSTRLERILPDEAPDTIPYELALKLANPVIRIPIPRPVLFTVRDNGIVRCMHYEDNMRRLERTPSRRWSAEAFPPPQP